MIEFEVLSPPTGKRLTEIQLFLKAHDLQWDTGIDTTVNLRLDDGTLVASGSLDRNLLKCIVVSKAHQGEQLAAILVSELVNRCYQRGQTNLFLFTKPANVELFEGLGFYQVVQTADMAWMQNKKDGVARFVNGVVKPGVTGKIGCIIANCDPFTKGHQYLCETACEQCDWVYLFILSENRSHFSAATRLDLAKKGTTHLPNLSVCAGGDFMVSYASFPDYFLKSTADLETLRCTLDLTLFATKIAPPLHLMTRFVGTEPYCRVTRKYNQTMQEILPRYGISVIEVPRKEVESQSISASLVRDLWKTAEFDKLEALLPGTTLQYLKEHNADD